MTSDARPRHGTPRWVKWFAGIVVVLIALMVVAVIFGEAEESDDVAPAAPTATEAVTPTTAITSVPTATPTPTPMPTPIVATCPDDRDLAGTEFSYLPAEQSLDEAVVDNCGRLAPRTAVCPLGYENAGREYTFDPNFTTDEDALNWNCGIEYRRGAWRVSTMRDEVDRRKVTSYAALPGRWIGDPSWIADDTPSLQIHCRAQGLAVFVHAGGYVGAMFGRGVPVEYSFDGRRAVAQEWNELLVDDSSSAGARLPKSETAGFVASLRAHSTAEFVFRIHAFDGTTYGTARFNLTGIELQVEPVLEACGW